MNTENIDKKITIMIVDDDSLLLNMYQTKFSSKGFEVVSVSNSSDALSKLRDGFNPDVILLDIIMPNMNGLELLKIIRGEKLAKDSVVVMLTNQADSEEEANSLGVSGFLVKAFYIPSEVVDKVIQIYNNKNK
jgi:CheY-like chemotaxis protein